MAPIQVCMLGDSGLNKGLMASASYLGESCHFSPCPKTIYYWYLSSCQPNAGTQQVCPSVSNSMHVPFKKIAWDSSHSLSLSHSATISTCFHNQKLWGLLSPILVPSTGVLVWSGTPLFSWETSAAKIPLPIFNNHMWVWDHFFPCLFHFYQYLHGFFYMSLVINRTSVQLEFRWFSIIAVPQFSCNFGVVIEGDEHSIYLLHQFD